MSQTVIGIFKDSTEAQNAREHLLRKGFTDDIIDVASQSGTAISDRSSQEEHEDFGDKISRFFNNLFGNEDESSKYSKAAARGTVVTVHAQTTEQAETAADILDDYGAVDVDEYGSDYRGDTDRTSITGTSEVDRMGGMNSGRVGVTDNTTSSTDYTENRMPNDRLSNAAREADASIPNAGMGSNTNRTDSDRYSNADAESDINAENRSDTDRTGNREENRIPIIEENLNIEKKEVQTGGQRIRSRIVERPVEETIRLRQEHVKVERNPVNRPANEGEIGNFKEGTIEVTENAEIPIVNKEARVVEEVNVFKDVDEKQEVIKETLRNTEVEADELNQKKVRNEDENLDEKDREHHHDDPHHQRPGII
jgi:uncharacterized protein (TIGR02271 family)